MNEIASNINEDLLGYQTSRLQDLISEMVQCCEDRKFYESQRFGLPYAGLRCLMLFRGERYQTVKGIAQKLDVAKSRVTKILKGLLEKGVVEQIDDPKDSRIKLINLTPAGHKKSREIEAFQRELHRKILLHMDLEERKDVLAHLELLRSAMEAVKEEFV
jgi:DNA-binding MarR family transcriptional regulator